MMFLRFTENVKILENIVIIVINIGIRKMKITFLGVSSALSKGHNSNILIDFRNGKTLLFDAGITLKQSLEDTNRDISEIDDIYISHLHSDHCGALEWIGFYSYFILKKKITLWVHETMVSDLWAILRPGMEMLSGQDKMMSLDDYFYVITFDNHTRGDCEGSFFEPVAQNHGENTYGIMYSYGAVFTEPICNKQCSSIEGKKDKTIFISSDTTKPIMPYIHINKKRYDYIFCDCDVMNLGGVHPNYNDLKEFSADTKSRMWLYHYTNLDDYDGKFGEMPDAILDGFEGFVKEGQIFEI